MAVLKRGWRASVWLVLLAISGLAATTSSQEPSISEAEAKATLLYNLSAFVEWPGGQRDPVLVNIGIVGARDVADSLNTLAGRGGTSQVRVRPLTDYDDPTGCHMLFTPSERESSVPNLLRRATELPILTVGDAAGFTRRGGVIRVYFDHSRIRFEISRRNAAKAGLQISSKLLKLATLVDDGALR
jgi:YfiR/HmsC-like